MTSAGKPPRRSFASALAARRGGGRRSTPVRRLANCAGRRLEAATTVANPWGAPAGRYVIVVYASEWAAGDIYETLSMQESASGSWLLVGYHVKQRRSGE